MDDGKSITAGVMATETKRIRRRFMVPAVIAVTAAAILAIGIATPRSMAAGPEAAPSSQASQYLPSISDLMITTIPPRRAALAGRAG